MVDHVFLLSMNGDNLPLNQILQHLVQRRSNSTSIVDPRCWLLNSTPLFLLISAIKAKGFDQLVLSKCSSEDGNVLREFLPREKLVAFDVEGVSRRRCFSTKVFDGSEWNGLKFKRLEGKRFPAVTKCNVQRSGASNVANVPSGIISKQFNCPTGTWDVLV